MNLNNKVLALREGGLTRRAHTVPYNGEYNVAMHSFNAVNLLFMLWDGTEQPSINLIKAVLWHDIPERWTGDVPSPAKGCSKYLKGYLDELEERILIQLDLKQPFSRLIPEEWKWLHAVDLLELYLWTEDQINWGNPMMAGMRDKIIDMFNKRKEITPPSIIGFLENFTWTRLPECDELLEG